MLLEDKKLFKIKTMKHRLVAKFPVDYLKGPITWLPKVAPLSWKEKDVAQGVVIITKLLTFKCISSNRIFIMGVP